MTFTPNTSTKNVNGDIRATKPLATDSIESTGEEEVKHCIWMVIRKMDADNKIDDVSCTSDTTNHGIIQFTS